MEISRRRALMTALFGAGTVGLRALATGLPVGFLLDPRKALANPACLTPAAKAQYIILSTSAGGDPLNVNCPGTYDDPAIVHSADPLMAKKSLTLAGHATTAAMPWATPAQGGSMPQAVLDRTQFWHLMTNTPVHPQEREVLELRGATPKSEMLPSLLAKTLAPCLNTIQTEPIALAQESLVFGGRTLPAIPPTALKETLLNQTGQLAQLQTLRDQTMGQIYDIYKNASTPTQKAYVDKMVTSQEQVRSISQSLLGNLSAIADNGVDSQIIAAITLIQMNVAPVVAIHIPFGGDNHGDTGLVKETAETVSGVASIASLMAQLKSAIGANGVSLIDQVTFMSLNVFGRSLVNGNGGPVTSASTGRNHNKNHQVSVVIGKPFKGGIIGSCAPVERDFGATAIDSATGAGSATGDISSFATLGAFGQTMMAAVGGDPTLISAGKPIKAVLA